MWWNEANLESKRAWDRERERKGKEIKSATEIVVNTYGKNEVRTLTQPFLTADLVG